MTSGETKQQHQSAVPVQLPRTNAHALLDVELGGVVVPRTEYVGSASSARTTIVARGQVDGVRCVDMLIDTGASCCFVRRSWVEL